MNAAAVANGYGPSYKPGTEVYQIKLTDATEFVRVYNDTTSGMTGRWIMKADDIVGLAAEQIMDRFALPGVPTYICDVNVPAGTNVTVSVANGILGGVGGGVQYNLFDKVDFENWFYNHRLLP